MEIVEAEGRRKQMILTCGGPRVSNELAKELGYDAGFSKGTYPYPRGQLHRARAGRAHGGLRRARARPAWRAHPAGMASDVPARLTELLSGTRRLALVGLAKNTGKTETLAAILAEHAAAGTRVGVTSIGRDGEAHDVIDARIDKPRVRLPQAVSWRPPGELLRASGIPHERLAQTGVRTPLGEVVLARLSAPGTIEVAGPSAAADVRAVSEAMAELGAEQVLIDGAIDRRAASSPDVADGLVIATGAVLGEDIGEVVAITRDAVDLVRLPRAAESSNGGEPEPGARAGEGDEELLTLERRLVLNGEPAEIAALLQRAPQGADVRVDGALTSAFWRDCSPRGSSGPDASCGSSSATPRGCSSPIAGVDWYRRQGLQIEVLRTIDLRAITVNPVAPQSHRFDSLELRELIGQVVADVPVLDVLDPDYLALAK